MAQEFCENCGSCRCKGKCIPWTQDYQEHQQATVASDQPQALSFEKRLSISYHRNIGGSGSTTSYPTSSQSVRPTYTQQRDSDAIGSSGSALQLSQLGHGGKRIVIHDQLQPRFKEWLGENRVPGEYLRNSFPQQNTDAPGQKPTSTFRLQCPYCPNSQFRDRSRLDDHMRSHSEERPYLCHKCLSKSYKRLRDLVEHLRERCRFRSESDAYGAQRIHLSPRPSHSRAIPRVPQSVPHHQSQNSYPHRISNKVDPQSQYIHQNQRGFPTTSGNAPSASARDENPALFQLTQSWPTPLDLGEEAWHMFANRRPRLENVISAATQVQQQVDDDINACWKLYLGRPAPSTYGEMLGDESEFESCDYSAAPEREKSGGLLQRVKGPEIIWSPGGLLEDHEYREENQGDSCPN
ncbi:hypothetical protein EV426DRAFT_625406 [Tirmania nivea]|nr:hypothetical protein EV426DRAFT_625406 [Tirmania nivea]